MQHTQPSLVTDAMPPALDDTPPPRDDAHPYADAITRHHARHHERGAHPYRPMPPMEPTTLHLEPRVMPARPRELLAALAIVFVTDLALWRTDSLAVGGRGAAVFFLAVPAIVVLAARARRLTPRLGAILALFVAIAARCVYSPTLGSVLFGVFGVLGLAVSLRSRATFIPDVVSAFGATVASFPRRLYAAAAGLRTSRGQSLAPVLVPAALVVMFIAIFGLANPLVARWLLALRGVVGMPVPLRIVSWIVFLLGAVLLLRPAIVRSRATESADTSGAAVGTTLAVARNALIALNALFAGYNALDGTYLWAGSPPPGLSERLYAHEGAAWLTVAIAMLTLVVGVMFRGALAHDSRAKLTRALAYVWLGQGLVLALGTFRRLGIHITTSGLSSTRILGMVGTALVVVGLVQVGVKLARQRSFTWLVRRQLDALVLGLLGFSLAPTHLISAHVNVRRVMEHEYQALVHAEEEVGEVESAAALLPLLDHDDVRIRRGAAALLLRERDALRWQAPKRWRDVEFAAGDTLRALEAASPKLDAVLGDVDRDDAIQPFEYIRNSAIEGEIALSEISKVVPAQTRVEKALQLAVHWLGNDVPPAATARVTAKELRTSSNPDRIEATVTMTWEGNLAPQREAEVVLVRAANTLQ